MSRYNRGFILITLGVFIILFFSKIFQHGLFFDGLIYASISNNLATDVGSFWIPSFSETIYPAFYEHPPLVFGLESIFMSWFDGAFYSEKLFSALMAVLAALFIALIWRKLVPKQEWKQLFWLPVLLWIITPKNSWAFTNNMLENTMTVFALAAVYTVLIALKKEGVKRLLFIAIAGGLLFLAFLSKGFPGLFPLGFFFFYKVCFRKVYKTKQFFVDSAAFLGLTILVFATFFYFNGSAKVNITTYIDSQVLGSINGESRVGSRTVLMKNLLNELIPLLLLTVIVLGVFWKKTKTVFKENSSFFNWVVFFLLFGLSASAPMMVSPKISSFYLVCALPYFAFAFAAFLAPVIFQLTQYHPISKVGFWITHGLGGIAIIIGLFLTIQNINTFGRDKDTLHDLKAFESIIEPQTTVSVSGTYREDWTTFSYFQRYLKVNINKTPASEIYYLVPKDAMVPVNYQRLDLDTQKFDLLKQMD